MDRWQAKQIKACRLKGRKKARCQFGNLHTVRRNAPIYFHPTPFKNFKRDGALIFESKIKSDDLKPLVAEGDRDTFSCASTLLRLAFSSYEHGLGADI